MIYQTVNRLRTPALALIQNNEYEADKIYRKVPR
jgi:hypothetical protein